LPIAVNSGIIGVKRSPALGNPSTVKSIIISARPAQWIKNLFVFGAIAFTGSLSDLPLLARSLLAFIVFCALSSAGYIINDILDREADSRHPLKKKRPIASGILKKGPAIAAACALFLIGSGASLLLPARFMLCVFAYIVLAVSYSVFLKPVVIIDVITVASGFVIRVLAGGFAISVTSTPWSLLMTFFLALFIALIKRKADKEITGGHAAYGRGMLTHLITISAAATVITYSLFTVLSGKNENLYLTIPCVLYGVFRYLYAAIEDNKGFDPAALILGDRPLFYTIAVWIVLTTAIIHLGQV